MYKKEDLYEDLSRSFSRALGTREKLAASVEYDLHSIGYEWDGANSMVQALCCNREDLVPTSENLDFLLQRLEDINENCRI